MNKSMLLLTLASLSAYAAYDWAHVQIQGGGYVPGVTFHPSEDLVYLRTDVGGAYRLNTSDRKSWIPLQDMFVNPDDMGSIAIAVDPDDADYVYSTGGLYLDLSWCGGASFLRSADRGASWTKIPLNSTTVPDAGSSQINGSNALCLGGNAEGRGMGNRIAARGSTIYLGTNQNGLLKSTNRGDTWSTVAQFGKTSGIGAVLFDKNGNIFAAPYQGGVYKSTDGTSWSQIGSFNGVVYQMSYSPADNTIWLTTNSGKPLDQSESSGGKVYRLSISTSTLSQITLPEKGGKDYGYTGISVNPKDSRQILVSTGGWWKGDKGPATPVGFIPHDGVFMTLDGGSTWKDLLREGEFDVSMAYNAGTSNPHWISALAVNPNDKDHVIFGTGYGIWSTFNATDAKPTWHFTDKGIEETVPLGLASTPSGAPLVSVLGDVDGFFHSDLNTPPMSRHKVGDGINEAGTNYDIDWAALKPGYMVRIYKASEYGLGAYSSDAGKTWTNFRTHPPFTKNQWNNSYSNEDNYVAVSADGSAIVWNMATHGVYHSTDNGATWTASQTAAASLAGFRVHADRVKAGKFYIYNASSGILYQSVNNGQTWTAVNSTLAKVDEWAYGYTQLFVSPDAEGELWLTQGANIYTCPSGCSWSENFKEGLYVGTGKVHRSVNGGSSFTEVSDLLYATSIAFGKGKGSQSAVYAMGMSSNGTQGIFRSENKGGSWIRINDDAHRFGGMKFLIGDPCIYSRVYVATNGRGIVYGHEAGNKNTCKDRLDYNSETIPVIPRLPSMQHSFFREGNTLRSGAQIDLYDLRGNRIRTAEKSLDLQGLTQGLYLAHSQGRTLKVHLH